MAGLNYIDLINMFWKVDTVQHFTGSETRLYFGLLHSCNRLAWKNPFRESDRYLSRTLKMSTNTIRLAREKLIAAGIISLSIPDKKSKNINGQSVYQLLTVSIFDTVEPKKKKQPPQKMKQSVSKIESPTVSKIESPTVLETDTNIKQSYNKLSYNKHSSLNESEKKDLPEMVILNYNEDMFFTPMVTEYWNTWEKYLMESHNKKLTPIVKEAQINQLKILSKGVEKDAVLIINQAIAGNYIGFAETPEERKKTFKQRDREDREKVFQGLNSPIIDYEKPAEPDIWDKEEQLIKDKNKNLQNTGHPELQIQILSRTEQHLILSNGIEVTKNGWYKDGHPCNLEGKPIKQRSAI